MRYCLGTAQIGMKYGITGSDKPDESTAFGIIEAALSCGIRLFDTAEVYGDAQDVLGRYFAKYNSYSKMVSFVSKLKPDFFTTFEKEKWNDALCKRAEENRIALGADVLYAYLFHGAEYLNNERALEAMKMVKEKGIAKRIGVSIYDPSDALAALDNPEIDVVQVPYNILDNRLERCGFFRKAEEKNVEVFGRSALLQGLLVMEPDDIRDMLPFAVTYILRFRQLCEKYEMTPLELAIGYIRKKELIYNVVFGVNSEEQIKSFIEAGNMPLSDDQIGEISRMFENVDVRVVNPSLWRAR